MIQTRKRSLDDEFSTLFPPTRGFIRLDSPPAVIEPSQLHLPSPESFASTPSTPSSPFESSDADGQANKRQRTRRNARTEEEKQARAEERAVRNRKAAQESRDRKKRQYETLEKDNERLQTENQLLRDRLAALEARLTTIEAEPEVIVKEEVEMGDKVAEAHYPAVVMSFDQQCQATLFSHPTSTRQITMSPSNKFSYPTTSSTSYNQRNSISCLCRTTRSVPTTICSSRKCRRSTLPQSPEEMASLLDSCATFDSLNTGSLDRGAEKGVMVSVSGGSVGTGCHLTFLDAHVSVSEYVDTGLKVWIGQDSILINGISTDNPGLTLTSFDLISP